MHQGPSPHLCSLLLLLLLKPFSSKPASQYDRLSEAPLNPDPLSSEDEDVARERADINAYMAADPAQPGFEHKVVAVQSLRKEFRAAGGEENKSGGGICGGCCRKDKDNKVGNGRREVRVSLVLFLSPKSSSPNKIEASVSRLSIWSGSNY